MNYSTVKPKKGYEFAHGLEYDALTGKVVAYHVVTDELGMAGVQVSAVNMLHVYQTLRPGEEIKFADMPNRPGDGFSQFESYSTRMTAVCVNLSYFYVYSQ